MARIAVQDLQRSLGHPGFGILTPGGMKAIRRLPEVFEHVDEIENEDDFYEMANPAIEEEGSRLTTLRIIGDVDGTKEQKDKRGERDWKPVPEEQT